MSMPPHAPKLCAGVPSRHRDHRSCVAHGRCSRRINIKRTYQVPTRYQVSLPLSDPWIPRIGCSPLMRTLTVLMAYRDRNSTRGSPSSVLGPGPTLSHPTPQYFRHTTLRPIRPTPGHPTAHHFSHTTLRPTLGRPTAHQHTTPRIRRYRIQQ